MSSKSGRTTWPCPVCGTDNEAQASVCVRCSRHRPTGTTNQTPDPERSDRIAVWAAGLNVGSVVVAVIVSLAASRYDDFAVLMEIGLLANVVAGVLWLMAGVSAWGQSRGLAVGYVVLGGGVSGVLLLVLGTLLISAAIWGV